MHHDCKLNNLLLDAETGEALCVIDLDTVMEGSVLSDFGELVRTATSRSPEDEPRLETIAFDLQLFEALARGYAAGAAGWLSEAEGRLLPLAGPTLGLMNAIRFLADFLAGDVYFRVHREATQPRPPPRPAPARGTDAGAASGSAPDRRDRAGRSGKRRGARLAVALRTRDASARLRWGKLGAARRRILNPASGASDEARDAPRPPHPPRPDLPRARAGPGGRGRSLGGGPHARGRARAARGGEPRAREPAPARARGVPRRHARLASRQARRRDDRVRERCLHRGAGARCGRRACAARGPQPASVWRRLGSALGISPKRRSGVEIEVRDPQLADGVYRHLDPDLPVAGFARLAGFNGHDDVVVALDVSTSTNEHSGVDVNGDGRSDDGWKGPDSIYRAQLAAVRNLLTCLEQMPHNAAGERIRVGIVTYSGDERLRRLPEDAKQRASDAEILRLATRDADVAVALTGDYAKVRRTLDRLERIAPSGMSDTAAGVGRALIELQGVSESGARSAANSDAQKTILLLTDGKPSLPFDRRQADAAASWAGRMAAQAGITVNAFKIGYDAVARAENDSLERMAHRSGGRYVALEKPGDVMTALEATSLSAVERVELANRTAERGTRAVATGIDGSFYGEVPLEEGENEIEAGGGALGRVPGRANPPCVLRASAAHPRARARDRAHPARERGTRRAGQEEAGARGPGGAAPPAQVARRRGRGPDPGPGRGGALATCASGPFATRAFRSSSMPHGTRRSAVPGE